jgi:transcriptional regulator with XRE-family HTH domain
VTKVNSGNSLIGYSVCVTNPTSQTPPISRQAGVTIIAGMDEYREFGRLLREARRSAGLSQVAVATRVGLNRTSIANIESGRQRFPFHMLFRLCEAVGVAPTSVLPEWRVSPVVPASKLRRFGLADEESEWVNRVVSSAKDDPVRDSYGQG